MAVVSRVATLVLSGGLGSRTWRATAAAQDTAAGGAVTITTTLAVTGSAPPAQPDQFVLDIFIDNGSSLVRSFALTPAAASQTSALSFTVDGVAASAARAGTLRLRLRAQNTTSGATSTYHVDSDGTNNTTPTGFTVTQADRGWVRGTTTAVVAASNVVPGGALPGPTTLPVGETFFPSAFAYPDVIYQRVTVGDTAYGSQTMMMTFGALSGVSAAGTQTFDRTHPGVTFSGYLAAVNTVTQTVTPGNSTLTGLPFTVLTTTTAPDAKVDPRLFRESLFQLDDNTFATPPSSKHVPIRRRLVTEQAFLADRTLNARGEGINGITYSIALTSEKPGTPVTASGLTTVTQGGLAGYSSAFTAWSSSLPSGIWRKSISLTAPAGVTAVFDSSGTARYVLGVDSTETGIYALVAGNPNLRMVCGGGSASAGNDKSHSSPGQPFIVGLMVFDTSTLATVTLDPSPVAFLGRLNLATGQSEFLGSDGITWSPLTGFAAYGFPLSASPTDGNVHLLTFAAEQTASWGTADIFVIGRSAVDGAPVSAFSKEPVVSVINSHGGYVFDGAGFLGFPSK